MTEKGEIIIYSAASGDAKLEVRLEDESVWLTQAQLVELFQKAKSTISEHISNIFEEGELEHPDRADQDEDRRGEDARNQQWREDPREHRERAGTGHAGRLLDGRVDLFDERRHREDDERHTGH